MKLSYDWLSEYVDLTDLTPEMVADRLTMGAFEVEEIVRVGSELTGKIVVGEILEITQHPNADKIRVTKTRVSDGDEPLTIVCGAANIEVGQRIPVALPGAVVLDRKTGERFSIEKRAVRGVDSCGMLCSPTELGIEGGDSEGILILTEEHGKLPLGADMIEHLNLRSDCILVVEPRSNRGDALSVIGLAREVAALTGRQLKVPPVDLSETGDQAAFQIDIESGEDCPYFSIRVLSGLKVQPAPLWIRRRLETLGLRPVNNIVDITNYVMLETGQPLHAYDLNQLPGPQLTVRRAKEGEKLQFIDARERELTREVMVITDGAAPVGAAGIMGGKSSEINEATTTIALEAACFDPARVRRGSRVLGLTSDSSVRFERGVDVESVRQASDRASRLLIECAGGQSVSVGRFSDSGSDRLEISPIELRLDQVRRYLEIDLSADQAGQYLQSLGFEITATNGDRLTAKPPSWRARDITREIDLIEEICRMYGYDNIPVSMPKSTVCPRPNDRLIRNVREALKAQGLSEAMVSSLRAENELADNGDDAAVRVLKPLSRDHQVLRQSLLPGLIQTAVYNLDRDADNVWLFETGRGYRKASGDNQTGFSGIETSGGDCDNNGGGKATGTGVHEYGLVAGIITGSRVRQVTEGNQSADGQSAVNLARMSETIDFFRAKGIVESLLEDLKIDCRRIKYFKPASPPDYLHPWRSCEVMVTASPERFKSKKARKAEAGDRARRLGVIGELHPGFASRKGLKEAVMVFELDLEALRSAISSMTFQEPPSTPRVIRDLTADVPAEVDQATIRSCIEAAGGERLSTIDLVSIFHLSESVRSLSYRLTFQDPEKTLKAEEIDKRLGRIRNSLAHQVKAEFRA